MLLLAILPFFDEITVISYKFTEGYMESKPRTPTEPTIGPMKNDDRFRRNWLHGTAGDAFRAMLCNCGHNLWMILRKLRLLFAYF